MSWCNDQEQQSRKWAKLDRAVSNMAFNTRFVNAKLQYQNQKTFDHCPMIISLDWELDYYSPTPFRFQSMWCIHEEFIPYVTSV